MLEKIKNLYVSYQTAGEGKHKGLLSFFKYIVLHKTYAVSANDYFAYNLDRVFGNDRKKDYWSHNNKIKRKWKTVKKQYMPNKSFLWYFIHRIDYCFSKIYCSGLDAWDYFAYEFYNCSISKRRTFITEGELRKLDILFNGTNKEKQSYEERLLLEKKDMFNTVFSDLIHRKWMIYKDGMDLSNIKTFLFGVDSVIVKPIDGIQGNNIIKVEIFDDKDIDKLFEIVKNGGYLIEELLTQHKEISEFNPTSINTIRIYSVEFKGEIYVTAAAIRIGRLGACTDNFSAGGIMAAIDVDTGIVISRATEKYNGNEYYCHPDSNKVLIGFVVPCWNEILENVKCAHKRFKRLRYIGWDICITKDSKVAFVEGNTGSGVALQQVPLLQGKKDMYMSLL